ncbi:peptidoglycan synthetase [Arachidicoccus ginsenosidimutans]|uniref:UDP-N-acetylmuramate--L-alanine ligase n=1 Tax=Arachidicoccus sp. BS20 TaxID=1850526 RepID=UPI0007F140C2|nr:Mur ligase family protein [Arachidicoccus sp. BS20]ANI89512.1 peptidoglycan synthetase [Arachidicoccus sp. BS20]
MHIHFISIGGSVMHQLAIALHKKGNEVTGSDDEIFEPAKSNLEKEGLLPKQIGWNADNINVSIDAVILGMHAKEDNPELLKAKELGLKIYSFPEYIYEESKNKKRIAIGGSHGKTTTTAMLMHVLKKNHLDFDYLVGARLEGFAQSVNITDAPIIVCEADEYPASTLEKRPKFHFLFPHIAVLTGIAWDHINVFPTFEIYLEQFKIFINTIEKDGILIYNETDEVLKNLVEENKRNDIRYQPYHLPEHSIENGKTILQIEDATATLQVFGNHNLLNLNAGYFVCKELGIDAQHFVDAIKTFNGAAKRLEQIFENENTVVYRDFAHAPSKVKATIDAVKQQFPDRKIIAVLELHTYSSLNENFMQQYNGAMNSADVAAVFYAAHALKLKRMPPLPKAAVVAGFGKNDLEVINDKNKLIDFLQNQSYNNSVLLLMSSGDYDGLNIQQFLKETIH